MIGWHDNNIDSTFYRQKKNAIHVHDYVHLTHEHVAIAIRNGIAVAVAVGLMAVAEWWNSWLESLAHGMGGISASRGNLIK